MSNDNIDQSMHAVKNTSNSFNILVFSSVFSRERQEF